MLLGALVVPAVLGVVFVDLDGDGARDPDEPPLAGAEVVFDHGQARARSDADGRFVLAEPGRGSVWVHVPDGYRPAPVHAWVPTWWPIELGVRPDPVRGPLRFVHTSDLHVDNAGETSIGSAMVQAAGIDPPVDFLVMTGDLASASREEEYDQLLRVLDGVGVPVVPVTGNHDDHDGGLLYAAQLSPRYYAFDRAGVRFLVVHYSGDVEAQRGFVRDQLADWPKERPAVVLTHFTSSDALAESWREAGVDAIFSGHHHMNYVVERRGLREHKIQPLAMGGDFVPAGFRVMQLGDDGAWRSSHHTVVESPILTLVHPRPGDCQPAGDTTLLAAVEVGQPDVAVFARIDGDRVALRRTGGWLHGAEVTLSAGSHRIELEAEVNGRVRRRAVVDVCSEGEARAFATADFPQLGGGPGHGGHMDRAIVPPLVTAWTRPLGGHALFAAPVVADGIVVAAVADLDDDAAGGVVAFDLADGAPRWQRRVGSSVVATPVIDGDQVSFQAGDGVLHTVGLADGEPRWRADLSAGVDESLARTSTGPVAIADLVIASRQDTLVAFDAASGAERWRLTAGGTVFTTHHASLAAGDDTIVAVLGRDPEVVLAVDLTGRVRWRHELERPCTLEASPVIHDGRVYLLTIEGRLLALGLGDGRRLWSLPVHPERDFVDWPDGPLATPVIDGERIYAATPRLLAAYDLGTRHLGWQADPPASFVRQRQLSARTPGWLATPVVTGEVLWIAAGDGRLRAFDRQDGERLWEMDLGTPITAGLAAAGEVLLVAGYDGSLRALVHDPTPAARESCEVGGEHGGAWLVLLALGWVRRRRL